MLFPFDFTNILNLRKSNQIEYYRGSRKQDNGFFMDSRPDKYRIYNFREDDRVPNSSK